jgi:hypothetical protein
MNGSPATTQANWPPDAREAYVNLWAAANTYSTIATTMRTYVHGGKINWPFHLSIFTGISTGLVTAYASFAGSLDGNNSGLPLLAISLAGLTGGLITRFAYATRETDRAVDLLLPIVDRLSHAWAHAVAHEFTIDERRSAVLNLGTQLLSLQDVYMKQEFWEPAIANYDEAVSRLAEILDVGRASQASSTP